MKSTGQTKKKTLYGRYDDYDLPGEGTDVEDAGRGRSADGRQRPHAERLIAPKGTTGPVTPQAQSAPPTRRQPAPPTRRSVSVPSAAPAPAAEGELGKAIAKGMELLGYGDLSVRRMIRKLTSRGIAPETASEAAAWMQDRGLIREDDAALRRAMQGARKLWGPRRIVQDLYAQGYPAETVEAALAALTGADCDPDEALPPDCVDFEVNCAALIRKKYGTVPEDRAERKKMIAALMRLGYDADTIREAAREVMKNED